LHIAQGMSEEETFGSIQQIAASLLEESRRYKVSISTQFQRKQIGMSE